MKENLRLHFILVGIALFLLVVVALFPPRPKVAEVSFGESTEEPAEESPAPKPRPKPKATPVADTPEPETSFQPPPAPAPDPTPAPPPPTPVPTPTPAPGNDRVAELLKFDASQYPEWQRAEEERKKKEAQPETRY